LRLWDVLTGEERRSFAVPLRPGHVKRVLSAAFTPDGKAMSVGYEDHTVRL
jgi:WD40 repeat protein